MTYAKIGVGVGTGKIQVNEKLKPGIIYNLPDLVVFNTGDEASSYEVDVAYHEKQPQLAPDQSWFIFSPQKFYLEPSQSKSINVKLNLPVNAKPGDYFAYLEGQPAKKAASGTTSVGVAAAAKLYFTVEPANILLGLYYKLISLWNVYSPWTVVATILMSAAAVIILIRRFLNIQINIDRNTSTSRNEERTETLTKVPNLKRFKDRDKDKDE